MEDEIIEMVKNWPKPKSIQDIQVFIDFANFCQRFIQDFNKIAVPLTSILKTTGSLDLAPRKQGNDKVIGGGSIANDKNPSKKSKNTKLEF